MKLMWWEYEQLIDHINSRKDIWQAVPEKEGMWLRTHSANDDTACCGLICLPPKVYGPYRQWDVRVMPLSWQSSDCETYLTALCAKWTDYGTRQRYAAFLRDELGIDAAKAEIGAIGLCGVEQIGSPEVDATPLPTNRELWPDINGPDLKYLLSERTLHSFGICGGGWLSVRQQAGMLRVRCALSGNGRYGGGYTGLFEGFIRPVDGNVPLAAAFLFHATEDSHGQLTVPETGSLGLTTGHDVAYVGWNNAGKFNPEVYSDGEQVNILAEDGGTEPTTGQTGTAEDLAEPE